ncbi:2-amino-4-hydroxy-6-hydroxymethyldihydropteridine diphosphokinase [Galactobacter valiniphilus]|uniref:2-amino-4-hydroxy-6-hydroxymethyldihydropteridine diphosphokinase n=1 Tax=Galactobacter valiniphilus TaxID=2676122 RepID=A0A399J8Y7_9MICC|nr:2-amino-4-hydroxy-6-hydroxymethyldihydropteridine diphosphokinase [Galactobacter valiniphilus]RII40987.1 2-amino-4-hydroxy-6-hydroxymethyldihydropteridine diphosphokinase [Galactobacter valiniphilus]
MSAAGSAAGNASEREALETAPARPVIAVLALGSNLGASAETLSEAIAELGAAGGVEVVAESPRVVTAPVGGPADQPDYLNQVIEVHTTLAPLELLALAHRVEQAHHRERIVRWGPRTLDIDIITFGTLTSADEELTLPHPRAAERGFVLVPWSWMDPGAFVGGKSVFELAELAEDAPGVRAYQPAAPAEDTGRS